MSPATPLSPVALFVYNRADNTRRTIEALLANTLAPQTDLYVFSDGGRDAASWAAVNEVRAVLHRVKEEALRARSLKSMTIVERPTNFYLERNIIEGITQVFQSHETIIVLEDDIVTSPYFLAFMNDAFRHYRHHQRVMHIGGFSRLQAPSPALSPSVYFTPFMAGWGWGTWRDRWTGHFRHFSSRAEALDGFPPSLQHAIEYGGLFPCLRDLDRSPIPWDICWGMAIRRADGLCLYPTHTLVRNIGLSGGTHYGQWPVWATRLIQRYDYDRPPYERPIKVDALTPETDPQIEAAMAEALTDWGIRYTWLGMLLRKVYKALRK